MEKFNPAQVQLVPLSIIVPNPDNPFKTKDAEYKKIIQSIKEFPEMLNFRTLVVVQQADGNYMVLGGNKRLAALKALKYKDAPVMVADEWSEEQRKRFVIADNVNFGEWDLSLLEQKYDISDLEDWGVEFENLQPFGENVQPDYSILDDADSDIDAQLNSMAAGVKKAIQIEFEAEHYDEAYGLVKFWRERNAYVGGMIMEFLKAEKEKL